MNYRGMAVVIAAGWMTGCSVGPNYHRQLDEEQHWISNTILPVVLNQDRNTLARRGDRTYYTCRPASAKRSYVTRSCRL